MLPHSSKITYSFLKNGIRNGVWKLIRLNRHCTFILRKGTCPSITLNKPTLPTVQCIRYLGITIDQRLTWLLHLRNKLLSLNYRFRLLRFLLTSNHIKLLTKLLIYKLYLKPMWTHAIQLLGSAKVSNINCIQRF